MSSKAMNKKELVTIIEQHNSLLENKSVSWLEFCNSRDYCVNEIYKSLACRFLDESEAWKLEDMIETGY